MVSLHSPLLLLSFIFPLGSAFLRSQTGHLYGLRHRRSFRRSGYTAIRGAIVLHRLGRTRGEDSRIVLISNSNWRQFFERIFDLLYRGAGPASAAFVLLPIHTPKLSLSLYFSLSPSLIKAALAILRDVSVFLPLLIIALLSSILFPSSSGEEESLLSSRQSQSPRKR